MELPDRIGPYSVLRLLGEGAMGKVYLARHPRLGREVAIKLLHERDSDLQARFRREAEAMARIRNEGVVEVYEAGVHEGEPYLVLEFCPGRDLESILRERGALPPEEAARLLAGIARGVSAAHRAGVIHRDLKPANVLVGSDGRPKVTDFGIAAARAGQSQSLTTTGVILGTPSYMAPEQASDSRNADARSDVYALGAILYECLSGRPPYVGPTSLAILSAAMEGKLEPLPSGVPASLAEVVTCALSVDPGDRYAKAAFLVDALEEVLEPEAAPLPQAPRTMLTVVVGGLFVVAGAVFGASVVLSRTKPEPSLSLSPNPGRSPTPGAPSPSLTPSVPSPSLTPSAPSPSLSPSPTELPPCRRRAHFLAKQHFLTAPLVELRTAAESGNPAAMTLLARRYAEGRGVRLSLGESAYWLEQAALAGDPEAMVNLVRFHKNGLGVEPDPQGEARWRARGEELGSYAALLVRSGTLPDEEAKALRAKAWRFAREDAERGDPTATGALIQESWTTGDQEGLRRWLALGLGHGSSEALLVQGLLLRARRGEPAEIADAFRRASELGSVEATCAWARCLLEGVGVPRDVSRGEALLQGIEVRDPRGARLERIRVSFARGEHSEWWQELEAFLLLEPTDLLRHRWGDLGIHLLDVLSKVDPERRQRAQDLLGRLLSRALPFTSFDGRIPYNLALLVAKRRGETQYVRDLFGRAARVGSTDGAFSYGYVLLREGPGQEVEEGLRWTRQAAEAGHSAAWRHLAQLYQRGHLVARDEVRGLSCLLRAAELGDVDGIQGLSGRFLSLGRYHDAVLWAERLRRLGRIAGDVDVSAIRVMCGPTLQDARAGVWNLESLAGSEPVACRTLASLYLNGKGVVRDPARGERYLRRARELEKKP